MAALWHCANCIADSDENYCDGCGRTLTETVGQVVAFPDTHSRRVAPLTKADILEVTDLAGPTAAATLVGLDAVFSLLGRPAKRPLGERLRLASDESQMVDADQHAMQQAYKW